jgi:hypothetical protein
VASISASMRSAHEIVREARGAAEAAAANRHRLRAPASRAAGERQRDVEIGAAGQAPASIRASAVPPRIRTRGMSLPDAIERATLPHRRAGCPSSASARTASRAERGGARADRRGRDRVRRPASSRPRGAAHSRRGAAVAEPVRRRRRRSAAHRGRQICVLASGDPFHYGVGAVLARKIDAREMIVVPAPSAFSLAAARLGWSLPQTALLSLHGRTLDLVRPHLQPGARILALTSDGDGPAALARLLDAIRLRRLAADRARSARRPARAYPHDDRGGFRPRHGRRAQHRRDRGGGGAPARASSRARPAFPTICSSTTARSPNAKCAR